MADQSEYGYVDTSPYNGAVHVIHLKYKSGNSISIGLLNWLVGIVRAGGDNSNIQGFVLAADGYAFSTGADLATMAPLIGPKWQKTMFAGLGLLLWFIRRKFTNFGLMPLKHEAEIRAVLSDGKRLMEAIERSPCPVVAAINGPALGGGFELATYCHGRVGTRNAVFQLVEVLLGIIPGWGGTYRIPYLLRTNINYAIDIVATGKAVSAEAAKEVGLLDELVDPDQLIDSACQRIFELRRHGITTLEEERAVLPSMPTGSVKWTRGAAPYSFRALLFLLQELPCKSFRQAAQDEELVFINALVSKDSIIGLNHARTLAKQKKAPFSEPAPFTEG